MKCPECSEEMKAVTSREPAKAWLCQGCSANWTKVCDKCLSAYCKDERCTPIGDIPSKCCVCGEAATEKCGVCLAPCCRNHEDAHQHWPAPVGSKPKEGEQ